MNRSTLLRRILQERRAVSVPGCHDALSAKVIESCDFEALQISGLGVAGSLLGKPDVGLVQTKDVLDSAWNISQAVDIPVMADIEDHLASAEEWRHGLQNFGPTPENANPRRPTHFVTGEAK